MTERLLVGLISHGASPRATLGLVAASRALALQHIVNRIVGTAVAPRLAPSQDNDVVCEQERAS